MELDDYLEPEVGIAVAVTAVLASPPLRHLLRRGLVYGMAGVMMAGDAASSMASGMSRGMQKAKDGATAVAQEAEAQVAASDSPMAVDGMMATETEPQAPSVDVVPAVAAAPAGDELNGEREASQSRRRRPSKETGDE